MFGAVVSVIGMECNECAVKHFERVCRRLSHLKLSFFIRHSRTIVHKLNPLYAHDIIYSILIQIALVFALDNNR